MKKYRPYFLKIILGVVLPFAISMIFLYVKDRQSIWSIMPAWNDEDFYYKQIEAILSYGQPLGYYGYDGSHAKIGHFGFHGFIILIPYVIFAICFGLQYYTLAFTNISLLSVANFIYILLYKPKYNQLLLFIIATLSPMVLFFVNTGMMEGENYFISIVAALLMVYLIKKPHNRKISVALGMLIVWAVLSKVTWVALVLPYMLLLLREKKISNMLKWLYSFIATALCGVVGYSVFLLFRANYFERVSPMSAYIEKVEVKGLVEGIMYIIEQAFNNFVVSWFTFDSTWLFVCKLFVFIFLVLSILFCIHYKKLYNYMYICIPAILIVCFVLGVSVLYVGGVEAVRTVYPAALFSQIFMILILMDGSRKKMKVVLAGLSIIFFSLNFILDGGYYIRNYYSEEDKTYYAQLERYMGNIELDLMTNDPFDNTLVMVWTSYPDRIYELFVPAGTGLNYYWDIPEDLSGFRAKYVLLSNANLSTFEHLKKAGYVVLASDTNTTLLIRGNKTTIEEV